MVVIMKITLTKTIVALAMLLFSFIAWMPLCNSRAEAHAGETWIAIDASSISSFAIRSDGSLWAWGGNWDGQLGDGTTITRHSRIRVLDDVVAVSAGGVHTMAIKSDGSLWAWGNNWTSQLGDGTAEGKLSPVKVMEDVVAVSAGSVHTMAIKSDGSLWAWGANWAGQLGDGTTVARRLPVRIMEDVTAVSVAMHTMAIKSDGSLWAWGNNWHGLLGDVTEIFRQSPTRVMENVAEVASAAWHTLAISADGSLFAWGDNTYRQLGIIVRLNGRPVEFDVPPKLESGRVLVPLRAIFEEMGASIEWDSARQAVTATKDDTVIVLAIGSTSPTVNGRIVTIDVPGTIEGGRTLVPLRFIAESFDVNVHWDSGTRSVSIAS